jgi:hypothetical protein
VNHLWCWIIANAQAITAIAAVIGALFTALYLIATILIFNEARKSADAAKKSADAATEGVQAAKDNALAAKQSASAAQSSADAASESAALIRQQIEDQAIRCETTVRTGVDVALKTTAVWRAKTNDLANMNSLKSLPPTDNLILPYTVVESAALIDVETAMKLSVALNEMRLARDVFESTRNVDNKDGKNIGHFERAGEEAAKYLDAATGRLQEVSLFLGKPKE